MDLAPETERGRSRSLSRKPEETGAGRRRESQPRTRGDGWVGGQKQRDNQIRYRERERFGLIRCGEGDNWAVGCRLSPSRPTLSPPIDRHG